MFIQHTPTIEFFEKNAMGWRNSPWRKLVWSECRSDLRRLSSYALCSGNGRSDGLGTDQQETDEHSNNVGKQWWPMGFDVGCCHHEAFLRLTGYKIP